MERLEFNGKAILARAGASGPAMMICATALMAFQDSLVKLMSADLPLWQLFLVRSLIALPVLLVLSGKNSGQVLRAAFLPWALIRSFFIVAMYIAFYAALPVLDLSVVAALYHAAPVLIVLLSTIFLHESVRLGQAIAIGLAFIGVLIVVQPSGNALTIAVIIPLVSALCYAIAAVMTRSNVSDAGPWALTVSINIVFVALGGSGVAILAIVDPAPVYPFLTQAWIPLSKEIIGSLSALAVISVGIHLALAKAYKAGPMAVVASLDYSYLLFIALWVFVFFGSVPENMVIFGSILIAASGIWLTFGNQDN
ncbi:DMT family transporter [Billgrantia endophytica]|uniref:EamA/RhaT family transporter n=1 Tax=Billgrantia endophytica TaxID=2033802 RepID=A0A2N7UE84_9GAMM|nr:DMT family transporter [Halomonas endophytica]PMR78701.1 EamA/RhaT family transporter [Halomonas endophytica]